MEMRTGGSLTDPHRAKRDNEIAFGNDCRHQADVVGAATVDIIISMNREGA
jgi:hypothetical protein